MSVAHREINSSTGGSRLSGVSTEYSYLVWIDGQTVSEMAGAKDKNLTGAYNGTCKSCHTGRGNFMSNEHYGLRASKDLRVE